MRALARSNNSNPQFHQLQLLPSHALNHQSQPEPTTVAAALAAGLRNQQQHHAHQHWHTQPVVHATLSTRQAFDFPQHQGLSFGTLSPSNGHHQSHSSKDKPHTHKIKECLSPEQVLALCGAVVQLEWPDAVAVGIHPLLLASVCLTESGGCPKARQFRDHLGDVALGLCQVWTPARHNFISIGGGPCRMALSLDWRLRSCLQHCLQHSACVGSMAQQLPSACVVCLATAVRDITHHWTHRQLICSRSCTSSSSSLRHNQYSRASPRNWS